jgi:hypothetical protein
MPGAALQVAQPQINPVGYFNESQRAAVQEQQAGLEMKKQGLQGLYMMSAGMLRDGEVNPDEWEQGLDWMEQQGADPQAIAQLRGKPHMADVLAKGSAEALRYSLDAQGFDLALKKFEQELEAAAAGPAPVVVNDQLVNPSTGGVVGDYRDPPKPDLMTVSPGQSVIDPANPGAPVYTAPADTAADNKDTFGFEKDLWQQYANADPVKTYETVKDAYGRVIQSAQEQSGAGDMALIYGYMRMLDPGSVVRESEFAMAAQAGDYGEQIQGFVTQIMNGQRLPESQRQEFLRSATELYKEQAASLESFNEQFQPRLEGWGVEPDRVIRQPKQFEDASQLEERTTSNGFTYKVPRGG